MKSSKVALAPVEKEIRSREHWLSGNYMYFPQALREAIPGPELPGCDRCLILAAIDRDSQSVGLGDRVRLKFRVEESGKLTGTFDIKVDLNLGAARALAATLQELVGRRHS